MSIKSRYDIVNIDDRKELRHVNLYIENLKTGDGCYFCYRHIAEGHIYDLFRREQRQQEVSYVILYDVWVDPEKVLRFLQSNVLTPCYKVAIKYIEVYASAIKGFETDELKMVFTQVVKDLFPGYWNNLIDNKIIEELAEPKLMDIREEYTSQIRGALRLCQNAEMAIWQITQGFFDQLLNLDILGGYQQNFENDMRPLDKQYVNYLISSSVE